MEGQRQKLLVAAWVATGLMVIGAIGPWVTALGSSVSGIDGSKDGWIVLLVALAAGVVVYATRETRECGLYMVAAGLIGAAISGYDRGHVQHAIDRGGPLAQALAHVGWGLNLDLVASLALLVIGLAWFGLLRAADSGPAPTADPSPTPPSA